MIGKLFGALAWGITGLLFAPLTLGASAVVGTVGAVATLAEKTDRTITPVRRYRKR